MRKLWVFMLVLLVLSGLEGLSRGDEWGGGPRGGADGQLGPAQRGTVFRELNLTADQSARVEELRSAHLRNILPLREKMAIKRRELRLLWLEKNPDQARIAASQKEIRAVRDQLQDRRTAYFLEVLKILTPEQQARLKSIFREGSMAPGFGRRWDGSGRGPRENW
jgi:Spy/CpxP family protein refolding chaperone